MEQRTEQVPIHLKAALTIREAAAYSNIGINKIDQMLRVPGCPFVLFIGTNPSGAPAKVYEVKFRGEEEQSQSDARSKPQGAL